MMPNQGPWRILHQSVDGRQRGLFPAEDCAGYVGGITSAACDGIRIAEKIIEKISKK
jgi:uncharacterized FAD-dependent dehydrogenase